MAALNTLLLSLIVLLRQGCAIHTKGGATIMMAVYSPYNTERSLCIEGNIYTCVFAE